MQVQVSAPTVLGSAVSSPNHTLLGEHEPQTLGSGQARFRSKSKDVVQKTAVWVCKHDLLFYLRVWLRELCSLIAINFALWLTPQCPQRLGRCITSWTFGVDIRSPYSRPASGKKQLHKTVPFHDPGVPTAAPPEALLQLVLLYGVLID